jgi:glycerol kinase
MQFQADILGSSVTRPSEFETTALGAAYLAGLGVGVFHDLDALEKLWQLNRVFEPAMPPGTSEKQKKQWRRAVERSKGWSIRDSDE